MKTMQIAMQTLADAPRAARQLLEAMGKKTVLALYGGMGAGKTTLVKALCKELGVSENVSSPSFAIVNEYTTDKAQPIYHFDFYRIARPEEAQDIGLDEYLYSGAPCFIEWPEVVESLLPADTLRLTITEGENGERVITIGEKD